MAKKSIRSDQRGGLNPLLIPLIFVSLLVIGAVAFGVWAFGQRQDYKNNVDQKIVAANALAVNAEDIKKDKTFAEQVKNPFKTYNGPADYGSVLLQYPKTWSAYIDEGHSNSGVDGYFSPDYVPSINGENSVFSLRLQVINSPYASVIQQYATLVKQAKLTSDPYKLPKLSNVVGVKLVGALTTSKNGTMVIFPLRDKTIKLWTEASQFEPDFTNYILPNFTFSP